MVLQIKFCYFLNENATTKKQQDVPNKGSSLSLACAGESANMLYIGMQPNFTHLHRDHGVRHRTRGGIDW